jgi:hypothetical protein
MTTFELDLGGESMILRIPERGYVRSVPDRIRISEKRLILAIGEMPAARPAAGEFEGPVFAGGRFDARIAAGVIRWLIDASGRSAGLGSLTWLLPLEIRIRFPGWAGLGAADRRIILDELRRDRVDVNGVAAIRPRVDLPILRLLLGTRTLID